MLLRYLQTLNPIDEAVNKLNVRKLTLEKFEYQVKNSHGFSPNSKRMFDWNYAVAQEAVSEVERDLSKMATPIMKELKVLVFKELSLQDAIFIYEHIVLLDGSHNQRSFKLFRSDNGGLPIKALVPLVRKMQGRIADNPKKSDCFKQLTAAYEQALANKPELFDVGYVDEAVDVGEEYDE